VVGFPIVVRKTLQWGSNLIERDRIQSEGVLFVMVAVANSAKRIGKPLELDELVSDASSMTIAEFREKWLPRAAKVGAHKPLDCQQVCQWLQAGATPYELTKVAQILESLGCVVSQQPSSPVC